MDLGIILVPAIALAAATILTSVRVMFEYEPVAAAYHYASRTQREETVLIADFGGGTSDFSLLRLRRGSLGGEGLGRERLGHEILGTSGVGVAGDAFDAVVAASRDLTGC